jgi:hypothetical protein
MGVRGLYTEKKVYEGADKMLTEKQMQEIQDLKLRGYSMNEILAHYQEQGKKAPARPTIRKYYKMSSLPEAANQNLVKDKVFDHEPFRSAIIEILRNNQKNNCYISSVYDVLLERFVETGDYKILPGNEQTLRNFVHYLTVKGILEQESENRRLYDPVFDTPPGAQMLIDFGQEKVISGVVIHFICLLLRYSRYLSVSAQDHRFSAEEACRAIYRCFCKLGGRPSQLVIDQDAVFIDSETFGEVIETRVFKDFCTEQELKLWVCRKADPESKGPIENVIGFVKKNFFSARTITCMDDVWRSLPGWVERKNKRIHQATFQVPLDIFQTIERQALRVPVASVYENSPSSFVPVDLQAMPYVQYKSSKYSVPRGCCYSKVHYKVIGNQLHVYDSNRNYLCTHSLNECRGSVNQLDEHRKEPAVAWMNVVENLRRKWNCCSFQTFINGFKAENARHLRQQLSAVERFLDAQNPGRELVFQVMETCCQEKKYRFSQFKTVYELAVARCSPTDLNSFQDVQSQDLAVYRKAFLDRCDHGRCPA